MKNSFEVSIDFFRRIQQFFMSDFLHSKDAKRRRICGMRGFFFHPLHYPLHLEWVMVEVMEWVVEWVINEKVEWVINEVEWVINGKVEWVINEVEWVIN